MAGLSENASAGPHAHTYAWHACTYAQTNGNVKNIMPAAAYRIIYFASAAVAVNSSCMTASSSTSWSSCSPPSRVDNVVHGLSLATITRSWLGETPLVQVSTTCALTCPETVHQRPCMTREIETWLSDSRVSNNSVVDHRSRRPVLSPLRNCRQMSRLTILGIEMRAVEVDAQRHQHTQANLDGLRRFEACCQLPLYGVEKKEVWYDTIRDAILTCARKPT